MDAGPMDAGPMDAISACYSVSDARDLAKIRRFIEQAAGKLGGHPDAVAELVIAANEALTNILLHGYRGGSGTVELEVERAGADLIVCIRDQAPPFDPTSVPPPDTTLRLEQRSLGGMGVQMMHAFTDDLRYELGPMDENKLTLVRHNGP